MGRRGLSSGGRTEILNLNKLPPAGSKDVLQYHDTDSTG